MDGKQPPGMTFGDGTNAQELGDLLQRRVSLLKDCLEDDEFWEDS